MTPGDLASGINSQGRKNLERSTEDARLTGRLGAHDLAFTGYAAREAGHTFNVTSTNPIDNPSCPYLSFESDLQWVGLQAKDSWNWSKSNSSWSASITRRSRRQPVVHADGQSVGTVFGRQPQADDGLYLEDTLKLANGRTVVAVGGRVDRISNETVDTPLKTNFTPSDSAFTVFNPSFGLKHEIAKGLRGHFTVGRAFIPAEAIMLTGYTTTVIGGRTQISQGNPDLRLSAAHRSTSAQSGRARATRFDVTVFRTVVKDRFISNVVVSNPPPPDPIVVSVANGLDAHISGLDVDVEQRIGAPRGPLRERHALLPS